MDEEAETADIDSSSSSDDEEADKVYDARIQKLTLEAEANPYQYDKHVELITALRASGDLDQLRSARENMCAIYPLSEELWLEWFQDELPLAVIPEQKEYIVSKFELAVKDYASIKVWHEYCQYMMNNIESPSDIERARNVFERAIISVGLHVTEGSSIWDGYREFEIAILDSYQQLQDSGDTVGMDAKVQSQVERIASIFKRQLSIPLLGMADTYKTYEDWSPDTLQDDVRRAYDKASQKLSLCMEYEEKLHNASGSKLAEYYDYIHFESKDGDPTRIQCVYERAIKENCLQHELWGKYTSYLDNKLKIPSIAVNVHERAVRNCPWISKLWQNYIKSLERNGSDYGKVKEAFNQSLKGGFADADSYVKIWLAQCDYHRRRIKDWNIEKENIDEVQKSFESAITYMNHYFGLEGDKYCILLREWAFVEAKYIQDIKRAQELWDTVMKKHSRDANIWLEYIQFLMLFSDSLSIRRAFQRAVQISFEQPEILCEAFIKFERQYGLLAELDDAQLKVDIQLQRVKERREKEALKEAAAEHSNKPENRVNVKKGKKENNMNKDKNIEETNKKKKKLKSNAKNSKDFKRKAEDIDYVQPREKKSKIDGNSQMFVNPNNITMEILPTNQNKHPADNQSIQVDTLTNNSKSNTSKAPIQSVGEVSTGNTITSVNHPISQDESEANNEVEEGRKETMETDEPVVDKVDNDLSVFLSNLLFTVEESHIRHMFGKCGEIETVRIIVNGVGRSKGYAYLEFKNKTSVEQALLFDRETIQGRPVFVSRCVDKKINPTKFKFPTTLDKHTLYVTNIPFEVTTEELTEVFQQCGKLKQIRIVTNRSGKSKGFAYIEYETEGDAANAIMKLDKHVMNNRPINVALSNPPARKPTKNGTVQQKSRPLIDPAGSRGRAKTQLSLLPRTIQK